MCDAQRLQCGSCHLKSPVAVQSAVQMAGLEAMLSCISNIMNLLPHSWWRIQLTADILGSGSIGRDLQCGELPPRTFQPGDIRVSFYNILYNSSIVEFTYALLSEE